MAEKKDMNEQKGFFSAVKAELWDPLGLILKFIIIIIAMIVIGFLGLLVFRITSVTFVEYHEMGYMFDSRNGQTNVLNRTGYIVHYPIVQTVHTIDLRPMQVCMNANARVLNCKLVKFNANGFEDFIQRHGRNNYDGGNCSTGGSSSSGSSCGNLNEILRSYAFEEDPKYLFLTIMPASDADFQPKSDGGGK